MGIKETQQYVTAFRLYVGGVGEQVSGFNNSTVAMPTLKDSSSLIALSSSF
jgi:hypothetical protein